MFDVDGTLVDTNYLRTVAWWEAFAQAGSTCRWCGEHWQPPRGNDSKKLISEGTGNAR